MVRRIHELGRYWVVEARRTWISTRPQNLRNATTTHEHTGQDSNTTTTTDTAR
jgi:hypothetical protein